jgi:cytochrome c-type biogenesis protein CcmH
VSTVKVVARLSSTGSATPQQGDWQAVSAPGDISSGELKLALKIDKPYRP